MTDALGDFLSDTTKTMNNKLDALILASHNDTHKPVIINCRANMVNMITGLILNNPELTSNYVTILSSALINITEILKNR